MSFFEFPHTRTYDSDLGWLIKSLQELKSEYDSLMVWVSQHKTEYKQLQLRVTALENSLNSFETEINQRFNDLSIRLSEEIYTQIEQFKAEVNNQLGIVYSQLALIQSALERQRLDLEGKIQSAKDFNITYTDTKIQELIDSLPDLTTVNVFNPVRGEVTNIQEAVNDLYEVGRSEAITALEYDSLGLTAQQYDDLELTAIQYDQYGRYYLDLNGYIINPFHYMTSPFTGELVRLEVVINELASLHKDDTLTASEYDALSLDADYYDNLEVTAFDYDWHSKTLVA